VRAGERRLGVDPLLIAVTVTAAALGTVPGIWRPPGAWVPAMLLAAPFAVAGLLLVGRAVQGPTRVGVPPARILLDALLLGLSLALVDWRFAFEDRPPDGVVATTLVVAALVADLVIACVAGLLALQGALARRPSPARLAEDPPVDLDSRLTAVTVTGTAVALGFGALSILPHPSVDRVTLGLVLVLLVVIWVRERVTTGQRTALVRRLHAEATLDPLTGLANRRDLTRRLARGPGRQPWCLLTLDLDAFKTVNDVLGHQTGDRLLQAVADRLREVVPPRALVARVGGDEFAVLLPATAEEAQRLGEGLVAAVRRGCTDVPGVERLGLSASVGLAAVPAPGTGSDPLSALSAAGAAQQLAKAAGRDRVQLFDETAQRLRRRRLTVEQRLRAAIAAGDVQLHYQPIVELDDGRIAGVEALARWTDAELGPVLPEEFVAVAEESGLVVPLGELVLHEAVRQAVEAGLPSAGIRVSCNVSPLQLRVPGFHRVVEGALSALRMPPEWVIVEVTEAALVEEEGTQLRTLHRLVELGVTVAIDDFGTGYSALGYLRRLPAQILKIDKSLTSSLLAEPRSRAITQAVTNLARHIGLSVVVEGVESQTVADLVHAMGAQYAQGSLFGAARPLEEVPGLRRASSGQRVPLPTVAPLGASLAGPLADLSPAHPPR
jgi:diguanylate cyclase